ncbi:MAG TPA: class I SAM-dependent methyltransferase [Acidocella sp.]|uniref:class I SAM-dependent methyltransferase n=1 Tax=Acidocella sp. TaxID=50710 RepID=UPI002C68FD30|nr:class I SAM-dependent methyltransferase [Acidocella sp.]HVE21496.1 class I SAM-dependent methyltransferase [Acidocella sp.]
MAIDLASGINMPTEKWIDLNGRLAFESPGLAVHVAPFPPQELMYIVSGLTSERDFAAHGIAIYEALQKASPKPLSEFSDLFDFGCGCGRLARMFKGFKGNMIGCDIDARHVEWINKNFSHMKAVLSYPNAALPFGDESFDGVISISVFSHMDERAQRFYLSELNRICRPGAYLFLTTHGARALERANAETRIFEMLSIDREALKTATRKIRDGGFHCIVQDEGHLTSDDYQYGITFIASDYVRRVWGEYFEVVGITDGAIHDFQKIITCKKR